MSGQLTLDGTTLIRRGGSGPVQPVWDDVQTYSLEWYRRFRDWTLATYPAVDQGTLYNIEMLVRCAEAAP